MSTGAIRRKAVRWSRKRRRVTISLFAVERDWKAGKLSDSDRRVVKALLPGMFERLERDHPAPGDGVQ